MMVTPIKTRIFKEKEDIQQFIYDHVEKIAERSVLVIASKIVALSEGRIVPCKSKEEKDAIIQREADEAVRLVYTWMTLKDGQIMSSVGVDQSNIGEGKCLLLPQSPWETAFDLRLNIMNHYGLKKLGLIISDSRTVLMKRGAMGVALSYAGFEAIKEYVGEEDIYGREFLVEKANLAEGLAAAAVLAMGEGKEQQPLCVIEGAPVQFTARKIKKSDVLVDVDLDMYGKFFILRQEK